MAYVLAPEKRLSVLHLLVEGNSIRSTERLTGVHRDTIMRVLLKAGEQCRDFLDRELMDLSLRHVQADEIWTFVYKKNAQINVDQRREAAKIGDQYLWVAFDEDTKLVATFAIGKRTADNARRFMVDLARRLRLPKPHASDAHAFARPSHRTIIKLSTDAFAGYPEAVDLAFGPYVQYGQLNKSYRNADQPGRYAPPEMVNSDRRVVFGDFDALTICTSHVERNNLTIRTFMRRFTRLSLGFSKRLENLCAAVALHVAHYNYCRIHSTLRMTPAMKAGLVGRPWSIKDLHNEISK